MSWVLGVDPGYINMGIVARALTGEVLHADCYAVGNHQYNTQTALVEGTVRFWKGAIEPLIARHGPPAYVVVEQQMSHMMTAISAAVMAMACAQDIPARLVSPISVKLGTGVGCHGSHTKNKAAAIRFVTERWSGGANHNLADAWLICEWYILKRPQ